MDYCVICYLDTINMITDVPIVICTQKERVYITPNSFIKQRSQIDVHHTIEEYFENISSRDLIPIK